MKILALYSQKTLSAVRRVLAPFSVLANRSYSFSFMEVPAFDAGYAASYDVTVLPNWALSDTELTSLQQAAAQGVVFAYDLAEPAMLQITRVVETLRCCKIITVPTPYLAKEVRIAVPGARVAVLPSAIDLPYMMLANSYEKPPSLVVGCLGPFDWSLVHEALQQFHDANAKITFVGDANAHPVLGSLVKRVDLAFDNYPAVLRQCAFGLLPIERERGQDMIWQHEYGILNKPTICLPPSSMRSTEKWVEAIRIYASISKKRAEDGQVAHERAKLVSATRIADLYLRAYRQMLPSLQYAQYN